MYSMPSELYATTLMLERKLKDRGNPGWVNADVAKIVPVLEGIAMSVAATFESTCMQGSSMLIFGPTSRQGKDLCTTLS